MRILAHTIEENVSEQVIINLDDTRILTDKIYINLQWYVDMLSKDVTIIAKDPDNKFVEFHGYLIGRGQVCIQRIPYRGDTYDAIIRMKLNFVNNAMFERRKNDT